MLFRILRKKVDSIIKALFSALAATLIILPGFLFIKDLHTGFGLLKEMALPYGSAIFTGMFFAGLLLALQERSHLAKIELIKSERLYRESQQRLDLALSVANQGIFDWDLEKNIIQFDARYYTISGYSPDEFPSTYEEWEKHVHPDDITRTTLLLQQYLSGESENYDTEFRFLHRDGSYMWIHSRGRIVSRNKKGEPARFIGTHSDITQRKKTEESLQITQFIYNRASIGIFQMGEDGRFLNVNRKAADDLGYTVEELSGKSVFDINPYTSPDQGKEIWDTLCRAGSGHYEAVHRRKDGSEIPVEISSSLLEYGDKKFSVAFVMDISERKNHDDELVASKIRYQNMFNRAPVGYVVTDNNEEEPRIRDVNDTFLDMLGYSRSEVLGTPLAGYYTDESKKRMLGGTYKRVIRGEFLREERDLIARDNRVINALMHAHPEYDANRKITGTLVMYLDITLHKQAENEAKRLESALMQAQKMEAIGALAGGIAHDFNNILGAIMGYTQLAQMNSKDNPKVQEYTGQIFTASERAKELIQQILAFSRQGNTEKQPVDLATVIKETLRLIRASIPSTIEIKQDIKTNSGIVEANQTQIHQVVLNLCTNAAHAMEKDGGRLSVELEPFRITEKDRSSFNNIKAGPYIRLSVSDTGYGMDSYTLSRIFEPYFTTKDVGEGTGMGLALVHGIIKDHDGDIKVYSEPGNGTSFHILFPAIEGTTEKTLAAPELPPGGSGTILFVDDEKPLADIAKDLLETLGYHVETRTSPNDALEAFRAQPGRYDVVITDMTMPRMNGDRLAGEIRKIRQDVPVILCTGFSRKISRENAMESGISAILMKPLTLVELANAVREVMTGPDKSPSGSHS